MHKSLFRSRNNVSFVYALESTSMIGYESIWKQYNICTNVHAIKDKKAERKKVRKKKERRNERNEWMNEWMNKQIKIK
jgi:hypothetical protein